MEKILIIGAGQAGVQIAASLRQAGFEGAVALIGAESQPPYQRPPLSKAYLQGELDMPRLFLRGPDFYEKNRIDLQLSTRVESVDLAAGTARLGDGRSLAFDKVAFATGAPPRRLAVPGADLAGVHYLRTIADSDALRPALSAEGTIAVIGAGYIGLEVAASARKAGRDVVVIEALDRPLARVAGREVSDYFVDLHRRHGVKFRFGARVAGFEGKGAVAAVALSGGELIPCAAALVGVGAVPETALAASAGLPVQNGVVVDERARAGANAWAAGDCANFPSRLYGRRVRLESAPNAIDQAKVAALDMAGKEASYDPVPWFWSDQYDVKLQTVGLSEGADQTVVRGAAGATSRSVWYLKAGRLIAVDSMNDVPAFAIGKKLIAAEASPDPKSLADSARDLKSLVA
jgi:3-phenylpropionate/trans-cinnamate dioxygenase ferredoxin reductase subunit